MAAGTDTKGGSVHRLKALIDRLFPDRQLFMRANDHVRFLTLSRRTQLIAASGGLLLVVWLVGSVGAMLAMDRALERRDMRIERQRGAYDKLIADVAAYQDKVVQVTRSLRERQAYLLSLSMGTGDREGAAAGEGAAADASAAARDAVTRAALQRQIRQHDGELGTMTDMSVALEGNLADVRQRLAAAMAERDQVAAARAELVQSLQEAQRREKGETERNATLRDTLNRTLVQLNEASEARDQATREREDYRGKLQGLEHDVADAQEQQQNLIYRLAERAADSIQDAERIVALTGIKPEKVVRSLKVSAEGGPFVPVGRPERPMEQIQSALAVLDTQLDRWDALQRLLRAMPFAAPLDSYTLTSGFGVRVDPFTETNAFHQGLDLSAPKRTPIYAPAAGVVISASRKDRYGKMIEIDHGMGIVTRYGHLDEMLVKPGDRVGFRTKIGLVGNTGRTSGSHVHYEVVLQGTPIDPQKFLDVGKYLYKEIEPAEAKTAAKKLRVRSSVARN